MTNLHKRVAFNTDINLALHSTSYIPSSIYIITKPYISIAYFSNSTTSLVKNSDEFNNSGAEGPSEQLPSQDQPSKKDSSLELKELNELKEKREKEIERLEDKFKEHREETDVKYQNLESRITDLSDEANKIVDSNINSLPNITSTLLSSEKDRVEGLNKTLSSLYKQPDRSEDSIQRIDNISRLGEIKNARKIYEILLEDQSGALPPEVRYNLEHNKNEAINLYTETKETEKKSLDKDAEIRGSIKELKQAIKSDEKRREELVNDISAKSNAQEVETDKQDSKKRPNTEMDQYSSDNKKQKTENPEPTTENSGESSQDNKGKGRESLLDDYANPMDNMPSYMDPED